MSVTIGSISAALLGVAGHAHRHWGSDFTARAVAVRVLALIMMGIAIAMALFAAYNFRKRGDMLVCVPGGGRAGRARGVWDGRRRRRLRAPPQPTAPSLLPRPPAAPSWTARTTTACCLWC